MSSLIFRRNDDDHDARYAFNSNHGGNELPDRGGAEYPRNLLISLVVLVGLSLILGTSLYVIRRIRRARKESSSLPSYDAATRTHNRTRLTILTNRNSSYTYSEKQNLIGNSAPISISPDNVPEIRITFPEEEDQEGRRVSGRVVVVKVGESGVGFVRPLEEEGLPPYQQQQPTERFDSVDIDRIGGLKELR